LTGYSKNLLSPKGKKVVSIFLEKEFSPLALAIGVLDDRPKYLVK
jgi:hypothetical protein